jgi:excisionase family DNA binding protein
MDKSLEPLALSLHEACAIARAGRTSIYEAIRNGELVAHKRGRKTLIFPEDLKTWVKHLPLVHSKPAQDCPTQRDRSIERGKGLQ